MKNWFLHAKHWQLFLGMFIAPFLLYFLLIAITFSMQSYELLIIGSFVMTAISTFFYYGWLWSIGTQLANLLPDDQVHNKGIYQFTVLIPIIFILIIMIGGYFILPSLVSMTASISSLILGIYIPILFSFFYVIYHGAKVIKAVELQRAVTFSDFVAEFFLLWFYIIGIWIIQPKINQLIEQPGDSDADYLDHLVD